MAVEVFIGSGNNGFLSNSPDCEFLLPNSQTWDLAPSFLEVKTNRHNTKIEDERKQWKEARHNKKIIIIKKNEKKRLYIYII